MVKRVESVSCPVDVMSIVPVFAVARASADDPVADAVIWKGRRDYSPLRRVGYPIAAGRGLGKGATNTVNVVAYRMSCDIL